MFWFWFNLIFVIGYLAIGLALAIEGWTDMKFGHHWGVFWGTVFLWGPLAIFLVLCMIRNYIQHGKTFW